jgi:hypothetical protein
MESQLTGLSFCANGGPDFRTFFRLEPLAFRLKQPSSKLPTKKASGQPISGTLGLLSSNANTQGSSVVCDSPSPRISWRNRENPAPLRLHALATVPGRLRQTCKPDSVFAHSQAMPVLSNPHTGRKSILLISISLGLPSRPSQLAAVLDKTEYPVVL